jgi:signal transduction histidine kinase
VLFNVITNAIQAAPPASEVKVALAAAAGTAVIAVSDRGPGISEEIRTRIFEPFFSTKTAARGKGLGLGLAISHGLVEAMGGSMDFENRAGGGTVFRIRLPLAPAHRHTPG